MKVHEVHHFAMPMTKITEKERKVQNLLALFSSSNLPIRFPTYMQHIPPWESPRQLVRRAAWPKRNLICWLHHQAPGQQE